MGTVPLVILAALGWAGFLGCLFTMKTRRTLALVITHPQAPSPPPATIQPTIIEPEIPEELHRIATIAEESIDSMESSPQNGEWKRHQVYAAMLKNPRVQEIVNGEKWKVSFGIELAIAQRRMNAEEVGA